MNRLCLGCMEEYDESFDVCPHCGYLNGTPPKEAYHIRPGVVIAGRYTIGRVLGSGGFGITYMGYDNLLQQKVAVKEYLPTEFATRMPSQNQVTIYGGEQEEQFKAGMVKTLEEAQRLAKFQDEPGICHVYDFFEENNTAYIVMEYLDGETLKEKLKREGKMTVEESLPIIFSVLSALKVVHAEGIIHRDIAPDNIYLLKTGEVKLLDFGASRHATTTHSKSLTVIVKFGYAPVEQYQSNGRQGPWTDVYALAATFYKMITGVRPQEATERRVKDELKEPSKRGAVINKNTENALMNALNIKIEDRTQSAEEFEQALLASEVEKVKPTADDRDMGGWPAWLKISCVIAIVAVIGIAVAVAVNIRRLVPDSAGSVVLSENQVRVPNLINMDKASAQESVEAAGLVFAIGKSESSETIREGRVLGQEIDGEKVNAGKVVDKGSTLYVTISTGKGTADIPDILWMKQDKAVNTLEELKLLSVNIEEDTETWAAEGTVTGVEPAVGTNVEFEKIITLKVAGAAKAADTGAEAQIPDLSAMSQEDAYKALKEAGLYMEKQAVEYSDTVAKGVIISQNPIAGSAKQGDTVTVTVSAGKEQIEVDNYQNMTRQEAMDLIQASGLTPDVQEQSNDTVEAGKVISQGTEAGTKVDKGTVVTIYVSTGVAVQTTNAPTRAPQRTQGQNAGGGQTAPPETAAPPTEGAGISPMAPPTEAPPPETTKFNPADVVAPGVV